LKQLPNNERLNDELFEAWCKRESTELEALIKSQGRKPARLELEALFHLVTGQPRQYQALNDDNGQYFLQAYLMAPASFRPRINETVAKSGHAQLVAIYRKVLAGREGFDGQLYVNALKAAGDEDSLFDLLRDQTLMEALDFCKRWAETGRLPAGGRRRQAAEAAVKAYRALGQATFEQGPAPPEGLRDLFAVWQEPSANPPDPKASDPLLRAQALYLGQQAGPGTDRQIEEAARSDDWPLRLVARLLNPALAGTADHVQWIGALSGADGDVLGAPLRGTSNDYMRYSKRLAQARQGGRAETHGVRLLEILCAFLGAFVAGEVIVDDSKEATERGAVTVEDAVEDAPLESF
jgi:hypothetical protein